MNTTLKDKLNQLSPERRKRIEERTAELIAETNKITRPFPVSGKEYFCKTGPLPVKVAPIFLTFHEIRR